MSGAATDWFPYLCLALGASIGWLQGALWGSRKHLSDLREHQAWLADYTASVNDLLADIAKALPPAPHTPKGE